jgi:hypothetical protein
MDVAICHINDIGFIAKINDNVSLVFGVGDAFVTACTLAMRLV